MRQIVNSHEDDSRVAKGEKHMCTTMNIKDLDFEMMINSMLIYIGMIENYTEVPDLYRKVYESGKEAIETGEQLKDIDVDRFLEEMREKKEFALSA